jgi:DNA-binding Lrp family transcriptional regulator
MTSEMLKYKICGQVKGTISGKFLLAMLMDLCDDKGEMVMSSRDLHRMTGLASSTVLKNMHRLEDGGYIKIRCRLNCDGGRASNGYVLNLKRMAL